MAFVPAWFDFRSKLLRERVYECFDLLIGNATKFRRFFLFFFLNFDFGNSRDFGVVNFK